MTANETTTFKDNMAENKRKVETCKLMECPVCYEVFSSRVFLCSQGHNVCESCKANIQDCPVCRSELTNIRNRVLEDLLSKSLNYECKNKEYGCTQKLPLSKLKIHQKICDKRECKCFSPQCSWGGCYSTIKEHVNTEHATSIALSKEILFSDRTFSENNTEENVTLFVENYNELFVYFYKRELTGKLLFEVFYIGPEEKRGKFRYLLVFQNEDRSKKMQLNSIVSADSDKLFSDKCLTLDYNVCKQFLRYNGVLQYFLKIEKSHKQYDTFEEIKERSFE